MSCPRLRSMRPPWGLVASLTLALAMLLPGAAFAQNTGDAAGSSADKAGPPAGFVAPELPKPDDTNAERAEEENPELVLPGYLRLRLPVVRAARKRRAKFGHKRNIFARSFGRADGRQMPDQPKNLAGPTHLG